MSRVLLIDDDAGTLFGYKGILREAGHEVATAALGEDGIAIARREFFDVVLCDLHLPDVSGLQVVREIHDSCPGTSLVLVTAWGAPDLAVEAKRLGAATYAEKPLIGGELLTVVEEARGGANPREVARSRRVGYAARRWAGPVVRAVHLTDDPKTIRAWCHGVGHARGTLKGWCRAAKVTAKESLDLVRLLRLVIRHGGEPWDLQRRLDIIDERTAEALIRRAGFASDACVPDVETFLSQQQLIVLPELVDALRERLVRG